MNRTKRYLLAAVALTSLATLMASEANGQPLPSSTPSPAVTATEADDASARSLDEELRGVFPRMGGLRAADVARRTAGVSPSVAAQRAEVAAAAAAVDRALVGFFPKLTLAMGHQRRSARGDQSLGSLVTAPDVASGAIPAGTQLVSAPVAFEDIRNQHTFEASLSVPVSDYVLRISEQHAAASHSARSAELTLRATELQTVAEAKVAYYEFARARLQAVVARKSLAQSQAHVTDVRRLFEAGAASKADVLRLQAQLASSQLLMDKSDGMAAVTERRLRILMHAPEGRRYEIGEDLGADLEVRVGTQAQLESEAVRQRPEIRALDETALSLDEQAEAARAAYFPRTEAFGSLLYANPDPHGFPQEDKYKGSWTLGIKTTFVVNEAATGHASARELGHRSASVREQRRALLESLAQEVASARQEVIDARASIRASADGLVASEESWRARRLLFRNGRATGVELVDAETEVLRARLEAIHARVDLRVASVRLQRATGRDMR
jgi:outer membrane protein TolC